VIFSPDFTADCLLALPLIVGVEVVIAAPDMEIIQLRWRKYPDTTRKEEVYFRTVYPMEKLAQKILSKKQDSYAPIPTICREIFYCSIRVGRAYEVQQSRQSKHGQAYDLEAANRWSVRSKFKLSFWPPVRSRSCLI
jgi:hypothetical protein